MIRITQQRQAILKTLEISNRPLTPDEILELSQQYYQGLSIATVYRNLKALTTMNKLVEVKLPGESSRYELAGKAHHHHFCCRICGRVLDIYECLSNINRLAPTGYIIEDHILILYGTCAECANRTSNF